MHDVYSNANAIICRNIPIDSISFPAGSARTRDNDVRRPGGSVMQHTMRTWSMMHANMLGSLSGNTWRFSSSLTWGVPAALGTLVLVAGSGGGGGGGGGEGEVGKHTFSSGGAGRGRSSATGGGAGKAGGGASEAEGKDWHSGGGAGKSSSTGGGGGGGGKSNRNREGSFGYENCGWTASAVCINYPAQQQHDHRQSGCAETTGNGKTPSSAFKKKTAKGREQNSRGLKQFV